MTTIEQTGMLRSLEFVFNVAGTPYMLVFDSNEEAARVRIMTVKSEQIGASVPISKENWTILTRELFPPSNLNRSDSR